MDDIDGSLKFDFEGGLETATASSAATLGPDGVVGAQTAAGGAALNAAAAQKGGWKGARNYRQTVCRHWLRGLCMKGDFCGYLHQLDKARMPICRFFAKSGECREPDCVYKHSHDDIKECNMYKLGFCPNGPDCRYRHVRVPGPPPPVAEMYERIQQMFPTANGNNNRYQQRYHPYNKEDGQRKSSTAGVSQRSRGPLGEDSNVQNHQMQQNQNDISNQNQSQPFLLNSRNGLTNEPSVPSAASPLPQGNSRYFIVKSSNKENLELSVQRGIWATHRNNEGKLNEAFDSCDNVILVFSVNGTRHFQGCARMTSKIGGAVGGAGWKHANGTSHYGRNFRLKWLKLCELSFHKTYHLRNPMNENLPVKISRDCQELEQSIGDQLVSLLYREPDSDLMAVACAAETKREEEKGQGTNSAHESEDPNIVPFEDNDDEQDDEESDDEETSSQTRSASQGRGKAKGWRGPRGNNRSVGGSKGMGYPTGMVPGDGFGFDRFGMSSADGFIMPDIFAAQMQGRGFSHFGQAGPRFGQPQAMMFAPMDGSGHAPGMVFQTRPPHNAMFPAAMLPAGTNHQQVVAGANPYMSMGRPNFMTGPGSLGRNNRPKGMPYRPPQGGNGGRGRKDQRRRKPENSSGNDKLVDQRASGSNWQRQASGEGLEADREPEIQGPAKHRQQGGYNYGNNSYTANNDESESEDEAPRRSRHGEGKKRRREWDGDEVEGDSDLAAAT